MATYIAGCLDDKGFISCSHRALCDAMRISPSFLSAVLTTFHTIDPPGMGARNVREALLIQLQLQGQTHSLAYQIIQSCFEDLLKGRFSLIAKKLGISEAALTTAIDQKITKLNPFPGKALTLSRALPILPDLFLSKEEGEWVVEVNHAPLPPLCFTPFASLLGSLSKEENAFARRHIARGKWLGRILHRRYTILLELGQYLARHQSAFLDGDACAPHPMTMCQVAHDLHVSESTITRAAAHKYLSCPLGLIKMRSLFTQPLRAKHGTISNQRAKNLILTLIKQENKTCPYSDQHLSKELLKQGIICSRRTVTKYRHQLALPAAAKRKGGITLGLFARSLEDNRF